MINKIDLSTNIDFSKISKNDLKNIIEEIKIKFGKEILQEIIKEKAIEETKYLIEKNSFDYEKEKDCFLSSYKNPNTKKIYLKAFRIFEEFLNVNNFHILDFKAKEVDFYISKLEERTDIGNSTKRLYIACVSNFFTVLHRWGKIDYNYFKGCKRPKSLRSRELKILSNEDYFKIIFTLENELKELTDKKKFRGQFKRQNNVIEKHLIILKLLYESGLRISAIKTLKIGQNGNLTYYSKGKNGNILISKDLAAELRNIHLTKISEQSIQKALQKACKKAGLKEIYNPHSIRHLFSINYYKQNKDIYLLQKKLNHSSISVTENYLKTLKV